VKFILTIIFLLQFIFSFGQNAESDQTIRQRVRQLANKSDSKPFYDTLIRNKETAIAIAEPILFDRYGKKNITKQKPYECFFIERYWYITGTLPKGWDGGVFEILIDSKDGRIVKLIHGK